MKHLADISALVMAQRKQRQLSQKDMRMKVGMLQQQYQRIEAGSDLKVSTLMRILAGLQQELLIVPANRVHEVQAFLDGTLDSTGDNAGKGAEKNAGKSDKDDFWSAQQQHLED